MYEKILIPLDGSELAEVALPYAEELAQRLGSEITLLYVLKSGSEAANGQSFVGRAPVVIAACAGTDEHVMSCGQLCYPIDVAIALDHSSLAAVEQGLGTCWVGAFNEQKVKEILGIPEEVRVVALMPIGYPATQKIKEKNRLQFNKIVKHDR